LINGQSIRRIVVFKRGENSINANLKDVQIYRTITVCQTTTEMGGLQINKINQEYKRKKVRF